MCTRIFEIKPSGMMTDSYHLVGATTCPHCERADVGVVNDRGKKGKPRFHYLEEHHSEKDELCTGSNKYLTSFTMTGRRAMDIPYHHEGECFIRLNPHGMCPECEFIPQKNDICFVPYCTECDIPLFGSACAVCQRIYTLMP